MSLCTFMQLQKRVWKTTWYRHTFRKDHARQLQDGYHDTISLNVRSVRHRARIKRQRPEERQPHFHKACVLLAAHLTLRGEANGFFLGKPRTRSPARTFSLASWLREKEMHWMHTPLRRRLPNACTRGQTRPLRQASEASSLWGDPSRTYGEAWEKGSMQSCCCINHLLSRCQQVEQKCDHNIASELPPFSCYLVLAAYVRTNAHQLKTIRIKVQIHS